MKKKCILLAVTTVLFILNHLYSQEIRINCGGDEKVYDTWDWVFYADQPYNSTDGYGYLGTGTEGAWNNINAQNTALSSIYCSYRENFDHYRFNVPEGEYLVQFYFMEAEAHWYEQNRIRFIYNDDPICRFFDTWEQSGREYGQIHSFGINHGGGNMDLSVEADGFLPKLNGIAVIPSSYSENYSRTISRLEATGAHFEAILYWHWFKHDGIRGYLIEKSSDGSHWECLPDTYYVTCARIPMYSGETCQFRVKSIDVWGHVSSPTSPQEVTAISWESDLPVYHLNIEDEQMDLLFSDIESEEYKDASVLLSDGEYFDNVGVRFRGASNRGRQKKSYKIKIRGDEWHGRKKLNLVAEWTDPSLIRDALAYKIADRMGIETPDGEFVLLDLNGQAMGVFYDIEQLDERYLRARSFNEDDIIFKAISGALYEDFSMEEILERWERETGDEDDYAPLLDFLSVLNTTEDSIFYYVADSLLDQEAFFTWWTSMVTFGNFDFIGGNHYLRKQISDGKWYFIPWDNDVTFRRENVPILIGLVDNNNNLRTRPNVIIKRFLDQPELRGKFLRGLEQRIEDIFVSGLANELIDSLYDYIEYEGSIDFDKYYRSNNYSYYYGFDLMREFINERTEYILDEIEANRDPISDLQIVEIAINDGFFVDEFDEVEPWCEILNLSGGTLRLDGYSITDDPAIPGKWMLPNIELSDSERFLFFIDGEPEEGDLHSNFELTQPKLYLFGPSRLCIDAFVCDSTLREGYSSMRYPEISENIYITDEPSPFDSNRITGREIGNKEFEINLSPMPVYERTTISLSKRANLRLFDLSGRLRRDFGLGIAFSLNVDDLSSGVYFLEATLQNGKIVTKKIVILK